jgi:hypothetical protein
LPAQHEGLEDKRSQLKRGASAYQKEKAKRSAAVEGAVAVKENCLQAQKEVLEAATLEQVSTGSWVNTSRRILEIL